MRAAASTTFAPARARHDARAVHGLRRLAAGARIGPPALARLAAGRPVPQCRAHELLGRSGSAGLLDAGAASIVDDWFVPRVRVVATADLPAVVVAGPVDRPVAYTGLDTVWLAEAVSRIEAGPGAGAGPTGAAAELGCGTGLVAAVLARTHRVVVAADLDPGAVELAALTFALDGRPRDHRVLATVADGADGLRPGAFDLVAVNPPNMIDTDSPWDDGGPTGFEVPRRMLAGAVSLLRPGGTVVATILDVRYDDGRWPLRSLCRGWRRLGLAVAVTDSPALDEWPTMEADLRLRFAGSIGVRHALVTITRPGRPGQTGASTRGRGERIGG